MKQEETTDINNVISVEAQNVIPFLNAHNTISLYDLEDMLGSLEDYGYLSEQGQSFRRAVWALFIKRRIN